MHNEVSYNALVSAGEKGKEPRRAFDVCAALMRQAVKPDIDNYNALISSYLKGKAIRRAFDASRACCDELRVHRAPRRGHVCAAMPRQAMTPNMVSYRALVRAGEMGKEMHGAFRSCSDMLRQG